jgi:Xaa-Pro dipeptidase
MSIDRRRLVQLATVAGLASVAPSRARAAEEREATPLPAPIRALTPLPDPPKPITLDERRARIRRAQELLASHQLDAIVLGPTTSLTYFTGARWGISERFFGAVVSRQGDPAWVTPAFEQRRAEEQIQLGSDVRAWQEDESPYGYVAGILRDRSATARIGIDEAMPFAFSHGIAQALPAATLSSAAPVTAGCRMVKDVHEIAIMRHANEITMRAHRAVFASLQPGTSHDDAARWNAEAHKQMGVEGGSLVLFGSDAAFPHGTTKPKALAEGDVVLLDGGCDFLGYASDISRTMIFGRAPSDRQQKVWDLVRRAQDAAFRTIRPGVECQAVDAAARKVIVDGGFGPGFKYFTHRLGHGIGMNGHEHTYLVHGNTAKLEPGMCFSDEPGIYIPGELGVRHEDIVYVTPDGAANMTRWTGPPSDPAQV